jgi:hypothetical protein
MFPMVIVERTPNAGAMLEVTSTVTARTATAVASAEMASGGTRCPATEDRRGRAARD